MAVFKPISLDLCNELHWCARLAAYGAPIAASDNHPLCVTYLGLKHAQEAISIPEFGAS